VRSPTFDFAGYLRFLRRWLTDGRWTARRAFIFVVFVLVFPLLELKIWLGYALDSLFHRDWRREKVVAPVFVVGNFRSGTTFLHRLLAKDTERFSTMEMWEILLSPSIVQRRFVRLLARIDRAVGGPLYRSLVGVEDDWKQRNVMHEISFRQPEEDEYVWIHCFSALTLGMSAGLLDLARPFLRFDHEIPARRRRQLFEYYRDCLQRFLHDRRLRDGGPPGTYLAKNPALTPKLRSVLEQFPDARVVVLVRNPLETIPSFISLMRKQWDMVGIPDHDGLSEFLFDMAGHWYRDPVEALHGVDERQVLFVRYDDLVSDPEGTVRRMYRQFGLDVGPAFDSILREETAKARAYRSRHRYDLEELGLTRERIVDELSDVFERYGFPTGEPIAQGVQRLR
jgi:hypothetical protein